MNLTLDPTTHIYRNERGDIVPSVTQILQCAGLVDFSGIAPAVLEAAAERGTIVHTITEYLDKGTLDEESIDPSLMGYVDGYRAFLKQFGIRKFMSIEKMIYHKALSYAGKLDRVVISFDGPLLYDIKTGCKEAAHEVQLAGYHFALENQKEIEKTGTLYLSEDGKFEFVPADTKRAWPVFLAALTVTKWKMNNGLWRP
jgi:hypothetical protein